MKNKLQQGFTIIELLIVIAVIGVLAVAVLSAINPVEQIRKAEDARRLTTATNILNSLERYYATNLAYPWAAVAQVATCPTFHTLAAEDCVVTAQAPIDLTTLATVGEVKPDFAAGHYWDYYINQDGGNGALTVCVAPKSTSWLTKYAKYTITGATGTAYMCVPGTQ